MTISEVINAAVAQNRQHITRTEWDRGEILLISGEFLLNERDNRTILRTHELIATDWEVVDWI